MKAPPPQNVTPVTVARDFGMALICLAIGLFSEFQTIPHPLVPISDAPNLAIVGAGLGCAAGVAQRYFPRWSRFLVYVLAVLMVLWQASAMTSGLPLAVLMFMFFATRAALMVPDVKFSE